MFKRRLHSFVASHIFSANTKAPLQAFTLPLVEQITAMRQWQIIQEGGKYEARLCWRSSQTALTASGALIDGVQELSEINKKLLIQQRAICSEPNKP